MKFFVVVLFVAVACFSASVAAAALKDAAKQTQVEQQQAVADAANPAETQRFRKSAYGGSSSGGYGSAQASMPAPPCAKNYLFSCQPNLVPVPCAAPQPSHQGAYSAPVPIIVRPLEQALY